MRRVALVALFGALALVACGSNVESGVVVAKNHRAASTTIVQNCIVQPRGGCIFVPSTIRRDECWELTLRDEAGDEGSICVTADEWESINYGQRVEVAP